MGIFSGWRMDGVGREGLVDPGEELGCSKIGAEPIFRTFPSLPQDFFCAAVFIGMFKCSRA